MIILLSSSYSLRICYKDGSTSFLRWVQKQFDTKFKINIFTSQFFKIKNILIVSRSDPCLILFIVCCGRAVTRTGLELCCFRSAVCGHYWYLSKTSLLTWCISTYAKNNLWKFELNWSSKLQGKNGRKNAIDTQSCVLSDAWFWDLKILFWGLSFSGK